MDMLQNHQKPSQTTPNGFQRSLRWFEVVSDGFEAFCYGNPSKPSETTSDHPKWFLKIIWSGLGWFLMVLKHFYAILKISILGAYP